MRPDVTRVCHLAQVSSLQFVGVEHWRRNFQLSTSVFHNFIFWVNIVWHFRFLDDPVLFCFAFRCIRHMLPRRFLGLFVFCQSPLSPDQVYPSGRLSFDKMKLVKSVHAFGNSLSPSTFQ